MPKNISQQYIEEKNRLSSRGAWITIAEVHFPETESGKFAFNTEDVEYDYKTWKGIPIEADSIRETREGELPELNFTVVDIERIMLPELDYNKGGIGIDVDLHIINDAHLDLDPILSERFQISKTSVDHLCRIQFTLSVTDAATFRSPPNRFIRGFCRYEEFKGPLCQYDGTEEECDRTLKRCRELGNQKRFGGFPGLGPFGYRRIQGP